MTATTFIIAVMVGTVIFGIAGYFIGEKIEDKELEEKRKNLRQE